MKLASSVVVTVCLLAGCGHRIEQYTLPDQVTDFAILYRENCAGCHGKDGRNGAARPLNDPLYLALIGRNRMREVIGKGVPHTGMPPFAQDAGGTLTAQQIDILAGEMETRWARPQDYIGVALPPYSAEPGERDRGERVFRTYCVTCHGDDGKGGPKGGSVVAPEFLALVSDQDLRTMVIVGRSDESIPDWRRDVSQRVMTPEEISDVVAWLAGHREPVDNIAQAGGNRQ